MNEADINKLHQSIQTLLYQHRLKEAQAQTEALIAQTGDWNLQNRQEQNSMSYKYMLDYLRQGLDDPGRLDLYRRLNAEEKEIAYRARILALDKVSPRYYHEVRRSYAHLQQQPPSMEGRLRILQDIHDTIALHQLAPADAPIPDDLRQNFETNVNQLFLDVWTGEYWTAEDTKQALLWLETGAAPLPALCLMVSAVGMNQLEIFDPAKIHWLLLATDLPDTEPRERALVGLTMALLHWGKRVDDYPELMNLIQSYDRERDLGERMNTVVIQLHRSCETDRIKRKMQEEIIPTVIQNKDLFRRLSLNLEEEDEDFNPDWDKTFENTGLNDKLKEITDLQLKGNDVYMSTFEHLKGYPFFRDMPNWFWPFDPRHSAVCKVLEQLDGPGPALRPFLETGFVCNSDKYSMLLMLGNLPSGKRDLMLKQLNQQFSDIPENSGQLGNLQNHAINPEIVSNQYIHDLYRFFKLFRRRTEFNDPFKEPMSPYDAPATRNLLQKPELMRGLADLYFSQEKWSQAAEIYQILSYFEDPDAELFQRLGLCYQKQKEYGQAIEAYHRADVLKPDSLWTLRHAATCQRLSGDYEKAIELYQRAQEVRPNDLSLIYYEGICLLALQQYEEAQQCFFRVDLEEENSLRAWRGIGWSALMLNKWEQALDYYNRIPETNRTGDDWLNLGHVYLVSDDLPHAAETYSLAASCYGSHEEFCQAFDRDREALIELDADDAILPLIKDLVL